MSARCSAPHPHHRFRRCALRPAVWRWFLCLGALLFAGCAEDGGTAEYPSRPIKVIVPFEAGGGTDTFTRILQRAIEDEGLLPQPLVILNVPGAGATIGSRRVKTASPDGYTLLVLHDALFTAKHSGKVPYGPEAFEVIAGTGDVALVIAVRDDSPYASLTELMQAAKQRPGEILFSSNMGAPVHFGGLMLEQAAPGARFRYVQNGGGTKRFAALLGGHADVTVFSVAEYLTFKPEGVRALAYCGYARHPDVADVPTAAEQGYDVVSRNMHFWWAPLGTPRERLDVIAAALDKAMRSPEVLKQLDTLKIDASYLVKDELAAEIADREQRVAQVAQRPTRELPDFPRLGLWAVGLLGTIYAVQRGTAYRRRAAQAEPIDDSPESNAARSVSCRAAALTVLLTALYVGLMQGEAIGFRPATALFVAAVGLLLSRGDKRLSVWVLVLAATLSVGLHAVMTQLFVIDLP